MGTLAGALYVVFNKKFESNTPTKLSNVEEEDKKRLELEKKLELTEKKYEEEARKNNTEKVKETQKSLETKTDEVLASDKKQEAVTTYLNETSKIMRDK